MAFLAMVLLFNCFTFSAYAKSIAEKASKYTFGTKVTGTIPRNYVTNDWGDKYFKLVVDKQSRLDFEVWGRNKRAGNRRLEVYDSNGNIVLQSSDVSWSYNKVTEDEVGRCSMVFEPGTYYAEYHTRDEYSFYCGIEVLDNGGSPAGGGWESDNVGWRYANLDGSYKANEWLEDNGKWYYFNAYGYMLVNTVSPDGYQIGADGAWIR